MSAAARRPRLWPAALATLVGCAILAALGTWQLQRLAWKRDLIARIERRAVAEPVPLAEALARAGDRDGLEFARVRLAGRFVHGAEMPVLVTLKEGTGYQIVTPLVAGDAVVAVVRGFVPTVLKEPASRPAGQVEGPVEIVGRVRWSDAGNRFTPAPDRARNVWFTRDLAAMTPVLEAAAPDARAAPFLLELEAPAPPGGWPLPTPTPPTLANNHLQYAFTWYGLAATLLGVFAAWAWGRRREDPGLDAAGERAASA